MLMGIILLVPLIIIINIGKNNTKITYNKNESFQQKQVKNDLTFDNIKCSYDGKDSLISYTITNETDKEINMKNYEVLVKDENDNVITRIFINFNGKLAPREKKEALNSVLNTDLTNAKKMELNININNKN